MRYGIKRYAPKITKRRIPLDRVGVLISINEDIYIREWMDNLIDGKNERYDTKKIKDAHKGMPVFFHYYKEGIRWRGRIIDLMTVSRLSEI